MFPKTVQDAAEKILSGMTARDNRADFRSYLKRNDNKEP
jgi:hypothetical protein